MNELNDPLQRRREVGPGAARLAGAGSAAVDIEMLPTDAERFEPGWYRIEASLHPVAGHEPPLSLALSGPGGRLRSQPAPTLVAVAKDGRVDAVVMIREPTARIRFRTQGAHVVAAPGSVRVRRLGRASASLQLLAGAGTASPQRLHRLATLFGFGIRMLARGPRVAGDYLLARQQQRVWREHERQALADNSLSFDLSRNPVGPWWRAAVVPAPQRNPAIHRLVMQTVVFGQGLPAGWYRFKGIGTSGESRLCPDGGEGPHSRATYVLPAPGADGILQTLVYLPARTSRVTWDVANAGDHPAVPQSLQRIGSLKAAMQLLVGIRDDKGRRDWAALRTALVEWFTVYLWSGSDRAVEALARRHLPRFPEVFHFGAHAAPCRLAPGPLTLWPRRVGLEPLNQLTMSSDPDGSQAWSAQGEDPQFLLADGGLALPLEAGWYRVSGRFELRGGHVVSPCLYPDYGSGFRHEDLCLLMDPGEDGRFSSLVLLKFDVRGLRLDPSMRRCHFGLQDMSIVRMSRAGALLRMLDGLRHDDGRLDWPAVARTATAFASTLLRSGASAAGALLLERYQARRRQDMSSYDAWVRLHDTITAADVTRLRESARQLPRQPLVSLLLPVYDTPEIWLRRCLDSVIAQAYENWELCIADDASPSPHVREVLAEYQARDPRIRVDFRPSNGHIAEASNSALALASGEYVGLLDHDDELRPHALFEIVSAIGHRPDARLLYSDEDKIDGNGRRFQPYFKPDWDPDLLLGQNYVCHFTVIHTALVREVGGFRAGFEGSQDHDLILRCSERISADGIVHVPHVLYHWRAIAGSTALERSAKDYAADAGLRAVAGHLERLGVSAKVEQLPHGHYRVRRALPVPLPKISLIVPTRDRVNLLRTCVESLFAHTTYPEFELIVVDNQSSEPDALEYLDELSRRERVRVLRYDAPFNFSAINNWAVARSEGALIGLLNNDIEVLTPDWLEEMAGHALRPEVGAVGAMLYYPDDTVQHAGVILGLGGIANHAYISQPRGCPGHGARAMVAQSLSAVTAACLLVRRSVYLEAGGLEESLQVAFNDIDFCLRLRQRGYRNLWTPFAEFYHHESASRGTEDTPEKKQRFQGEVTLMEQRWGEVLRNDPAYNPNLSLESFNFDLAFPPRTVVQTTPGAEAASC